MSELTRFSWTRVGRELDETFGRIKLAMLIIKGDLVLESPADGDL